MLLNGFPSTFRVEAQLPALVMVRSCLRLHLVGNVSAVSLRNASQGQHGVDFSPC